MHIVLQHSIVYSTVADELALAFTLACPWPASTHNLTVSLWQEISVVWNSGNVVHLLVCTHLLKHAFLQPWCATVILLVELRGKLKCRNVNGVAACPKFSIHVAISYTGSKRHDQWGNFQSVSFRTDEQWIVERPMVERGRKQPRVAETSCKYIRRTWMAIKREEKCHSQFFVTNFRFVLQLPEPWFLDFWWFFSAI